MKSAYELAMERLEKQAPTAVLTEKQKAEIAEIDSTFRAKMAEKEVFLKDQIKKARAAGQADEVESLEKQLSFELKRLAEDCEAKKEKARLGK
ncbi:MAG: hypothetical protein WCD79_22680 [Chthoniobacteraceae bacterium]